MIGFDSARLRSVSLVSIPVFMLRGRGGEAEKKKKKEIRRKEKDKK